MQKCDINVTRLGRANHYRAAFTSYPSRDMLFEAQLIAGFNPYGYGGPDAVQITQSGERFHAEWKSESYCD